MEHPGNGRRAYVAGRSTGGRERRSRGAALATLGAPTRTSCAGRSADRDNPLGASTAPGLPPLPDLGAGVRSRTFRRDRWSLPTRVPRSAVGIVGGRSRTRPSVAVPTMRASQQVRIVGGRARPHPTIGVRSLSGIAYPHCTGTALRTSSATSSVGSRDDHSLRRPRPPSSPACWALPEPLGAVEVGDARLPGQSASPGEDAVLSVGNCGPGRATCAAPSRRATSVGYTDRLSRVLPRPEPRRDPECGRGSHQDVARASLELPELGPARAAL